MPKVFFDIYDSGIAEDSEGLEVADFAAVRKLAMESLPRIAADEISEDGDKRHFVIVARDEGGRAIYTATLSYVGLKLPHPLK